MPDFFPHSGEGAVSTGLMVPVHGAKSVGEARAVVELLERNEIPALVNVEVQGILFPWKDPPRHAKALVLVPSKMLPSARDVLRRAGRDSARSQATTSQRAARIASSISISISGGGEPRPFSAIPVSPGFSFDAEIEDDTGPIDLELPEPSPLGMRMLFAILAIAVGAGLQRTLELVFGASEMVQRFAARSPLATEPWRLITAGFLHLSTEHFFSNAIFGIVIGVVLFGTHEIGATALVWMLASVMGLATEASLSPSFILIAGASAGNYGLVGLWAKGQLDRSQRSLLPKREIVRTMGILLLLLPGALTPISSTGSKVAVLAHMGGFLGGFLLGFVFKRRLHTDELPGIAARSRYAMAVAAALFASSIAAIVFLIDP